MHMASKEHTSVDMVCPCEGEKCDGGTGWNWHSADLGNTHYVGGEANKAGRFWVQVCPSWTDDELPPNPVGISDITIYMKEEGKKSKHGFH